MDNENQLQDHLPALSWWQALYHYRVQSYFWAAQHWVATHPCGLRFCHSCSGYFHPLAMIAPDTCEACFARDYMKTGAP